MNKEIKTLWIDALRSGKYKQTIGTLKSSTGHCCLGVLCELYIENTGVGTWITKSNIYTVDPSSLTFKDTFNMREAITCLPTSVQRWAEVDKNPTVKFLGTNMLLSIINDQKNSFEKIADLIEEQL
jgi:hypothetical protein